MKPKDLEILVLELNRARAGIASDISLLKMDVAGLMSELVPDRLACLMDFSRKLEAMKKRIDDLESKGTDAEADATIPSS